MNKIEKLWQEYARLVLQGVSENSVQYKETRKAFVAGMITSLEQLNAISALPDDQAVKALAGYSAICYAEGRGYCQAADKN
jgi:hypothetical protein